MTTVNKFYNSVVNELIEELKMHFGNEEVQVLDLAVLDSLKDIWKQKIDCNAAIKTQQKNCAPSASYFAAIMRERQLSSKTNNSVDLESQFDGVADSDASSCEDDLESVSETEQENYAAAASPEQIETELSIVEDDQVDALESDEDESEAKQESDKEEDVDSLNSEDDVSDDPEKEIEYENVIVCQFNKIRRMKNKWKFNFVSGIANLNSRDTVFHIANGEAEM